MIAELKEVMSKVEKLDNEEQKQNSESQLSNLAQEALSEYKAGKTKQADW